MLRMFPTIAFALTTFIFSSASAGAQNRSDIDTIADWVSHGADGGANRKDLSGDVAKALGLTNGTEFHCQGVSFSNPQGLKIVFCNIPTGSTKIVARWDKNFGIYWMIEKGDIKKTVFNGSNTSDNNKWELLTVSNYTYRENYDKIIQFFVTKANASKN